MAKYDLMISDFHLRTSGLFHVEWEGLKTSINYGAGGANKTVEHCDPKSVHGRLQSLWNVIPNHSPRKIMIIQPMVVGLE